MVSQLIVNIAANIADMVSGVNAAKQHLESLNKKTNDVLTTQKNILSQLKTGWVGLSSAINVVETAVAKLESAFRMAEDAGRYEDQKERLNVLAAKFGETADSIEGDLERITKGMIPLIELTKVAGDSLLRNLKPDQLKEIAKYADAIADIKGIKPGEAFSLLAESLVVVRERQAEMLVGLIDLKEEFPATYNEMSEAEKVAARYNIMLRELQKRFPAIEQDVLSASDKMEQFTASIKNAQLFIGQIALRGFLLLSSALKGLAAASAEAGTFLVAPFAAFEWGLNQIGMKGDFWQNIFKKLEAGSDKWTQGMIDDFNAITLSAQDFEKLMKGLDVEPPKGRVSDEAIKRYIDTLKTALELVQQVYKQQEERASANLNTLKGIWNAEKEILTTNISEEKELLKHRYDNAIIGAKEYYDILITLEMQHYIATVKNIEDTATLDKAAIRQRIINIESMITSFEEMKTKLSSMGRLDINAGKINDAQVEIAKLKTQVEELKKSLGDIDTKAFDEINKEGQKLGGVVDKINWTRPTEEVKNYYEQINKIATVNSEILESERDLATQLNDFVSAREKEVAILQDQIDAKIRNNKATIEELLALGPVTEQIMAEINARKQLIQILEQQKATIPAPTDFGAGIEKGIAEYVDSLEWGFERGKDMAREAAEAMNDFFEDAFTGKIKLSWKKLLEWMGGLFAKFLADLAVQAVAKPIIVPIMQQIGGYASNITQGALGGAANYFGTNYGAYGAGAASATAGYIGGSATGMASGYSLTGAATYPSMSYSLTGSASGGAYSAGGYTLAGGGVSAGAALAKLGMIAAVAYTFGDILSSLVTGSYKTKTKSFPTMQMGYEGGEWGAYGGLGKYGKGIETFFGGDALKNLEDKSGLREFEQKFAKAFSGFTDILKNFATEFGMATDKFEEDWKAARKTIKTEADAIAYINKTMGDYAQFVLSMDFTEWQRDGEEMIDTIGRVLGSLTGMKTLVENIDLVIQYLDGSTDAFRQFQITLNNLDRQITDTKNNMAQLTDPADIFDAANELYSLTMQKYEAEIQFVQELQQAIQDLQLEFAQFTSSMIKKIADLGGDTGGFDEAIKMIADAGRGLAQQLMNPDISLGEKLPMLKNFLSFLDEWYQLNLDKIQVVGEAEIAIYEDRIESLNKEKDIINDQIDALQTQLRLVEDWQDVLDKTKDMIFDLKATTASPRDVFERLNYVKGEIERVQGQFRGSSGESQIGFAKELQTLIQSYGQIGQEAFQRPSMEYQAVYNDMLTWLQEIEAVASVGAKSTEDLLGEIESLQSRSNQIETEIVGWQEKIHGVEERMATDISTLNEEAKAYYQWAKDAGTTVYSGKLDTLNTTLETVLGPDGTVAQYIEKQRADMVRDLGGIKDYLNSILLDLTGYNALANSQPAPVETPAPVQTIAPPEPTTPSYMQGSWLNLKGIPSYQHGTDYVPKTGLAFLHQGEKVVPSGSGDIYLTLSPTINANGDATPREIWRGLEDYAIQSVKGGRLGKALKER